MKDWITQHADSINLWLAIWGFVISVGVLAFSALQYVRSTLADRKKDRFTTYHYLLSSVSRGADKDGVMKLVSQRAYIFELRHFREYAPLTIRLLDSLLEDWERGDPEKLKKLAPEIEETKLSLTKRWRQLR